MRIMRVTTKEKPILNYLRDAWIKPDEQDVCTEDIIAWLRRNIHRRDVGLWIILEQGKIVGCLLAIGPSLLFPSVYIYTAWLKPGLGINAREFFEQPFVEWVRSLGCNEITMCSASHSGRAWERRYRFKGYSRIYRRSLEPLEPQDLEVDEILMRIKEAGNA